MVKHSFAVLLHRIMAKPELPALRQPRRFSLQAESERVASRDEGGGSDSS